MILLKSIADWDQFRDNFSIKHKIVKEDVQWGHGPQQYPCLAALALRNPESPNAVLGCYVYPHEALQLVQAAGLQTTSARGSDLNAESIKEHCRRMSANVMVLASLAVRGGLCTKEEYEQLLAMRLSEVDQAEAEARGKPAGD